MLDRFIECWDGLNDPRTGTAALHDFHEILAIAMCSVLCGGQGSVDMGVFAKAKEPFLRGFLKLENGVPSHDTFSRSFRMLDPEQFQAPFQRSMAGFSEQSEGVVAIDGKILRRSFDAPAASRRCTWSPPGAASKVPKLLETLRLKGTIVTADALNYQHALAQQSLIRAATMRTPAQGHPISVASEARAASMSGDWVEKPHCGLTTGAIRAHKRVVVCCRVVVCEIVRRQCDLVALRFRVRKKESTR